MQQTKRTGANLVIVSLFFLFMGSIFVICDFLWELNGTKSIQTKNVNFGIFLREN